VASTPAIVTDPDALTVKLAADPAAASVLLVAICAPLLRLADPTLI
jgi:hypothetical protein